MAELRGIGLYLFSLYGTANTSLKAISFDKSAPLVSLLLKPLISWKVAW